MKLKPILAVLAVAVAALAQPALAGFTQNEKGELTHYNGIPLPPIQTVEEARAQAQKEIAAAKAKEAKQTAKAAHPSNQQSEISNRQFFFTGKPYLVETGQYLFLFRHYDPELARWTTADPSGFPDGANNLAYLAIPTNQFDWAGLKSVMWLYGAIGTIGSWELDQNSQAALQQVFDSWENRFQTADADLDPSPNYLNDGDHFGFNAFSNTSQLSQFSADQIYIAAHGLNSGTAENPVFSNPPLYIIGGIAYTESAIKTFNSNIQMALGCGHASWGGNGIVNANSIGWAFGTPTADFLRE